MCLFIPIRTAKIRPITSVGKGQEKVDHYTLLMDMNNTLENNFECSPKS